MDIDKDHKARATQAIAAFKRLGYDFHGCLMCISGIPDSIDMKLAVSYEIPIEQEFRERKLRRAEEFLRHEKKYEPYDPSKVKAKNESAGSMQKGLSSWLKKHIAGSKDPAPACAYDCANDEFCAAKTVRGSNYCEVHYKIEHADLKTCRTPHCDVAIWTDKNKAVWHCLLHRKLNGEQVPDFCAERECTARLYPGETVCPLHIRKSKSDTNS